EAEGNQYLSLEYIEGETLAQRLERGAIPVTEALPIAKQITEAVEAAHEKGIIHRDLKPTNIKFTADGEVKVLDFGLAKAIDEHISTSSEIANSPTIAPHGSPTISGVILGTAGYLSPEQARGRPVDKRADIFAFGCVLFEMLTGEKLFSGETVSDSLASTLKVEPTWAELPADTPPTIHLLLRRCLVKDRKHRLHDIADARVELEEAIADPSGSSLSLAAGALMAADARGGISTGRKAGAIFLLITLSVLLTVGVMSVLDKSPEPIVEHYSINIPHRPADFSSFLPTLAISPDGTTIAFAGRNENDQNQIYLRRRDSDEAIPVSGTIGARQPRFSSDGQWLTFSTGGSFHRIPIRGGTSMIICEAVRTPGHASLGDDRFVFCTFDNGKSWIVPAAGGEPEQFIPDNALPEHYVLGWPEVLPGGKVVLFAFYVRTSNAEPSIIAYDMSTNEITTLVEKGTYPRYAKSGHLLYVHDTTLMAVPFDASTLELKGLPTPIRTDLKEMSFVGASDFAIADDGTLIAITDTEVPGLTLSRIDLDGVAQQVTSHTRPFVDFSLAPNGKKAAVVITEDAVIESSIWLLDFERDLLTLLTPEEGNQHSPLFSADGRWLYYTQWISGRIIFDGLYRRRVDGSGGPEKLILDTTRSFDESRIELDDFSPDGQTMYLSISAEPFQGNQFLPQDIYTLTRNGDWKLTPLITSPADELHAAPSPDGKWLAYTSDESGIRQVYIRPIDGRGARVQVSRDGGGNPVWSPNGSSLYFTYKGAIINSAKIAVSDEPDQTPVLRVGEITTLFPYDSPFDSFNIYPDDEHFLMIVTGKSEGEESTEIKVTLNFFEELKRLAPGE
ncbi:MAG: PD40 domain-containing protein, partial [Planctomycetes bacterium]|nr:PD40 domain-containing protein [Planctomycetota bacterium]